MMSRQLPNIDMLSEPHPKFLWPSISDSASFFSVISFARPVMMMLLTIMMVKPVQQEGPGVSNSLRDSIFCSSN